MLLPGPAHYQKRPPAESRQRKDSEKKKGLQEFNSERPSYTFASTTGRLYSPPSIVTVSTCTCTCTCTCIYMYILPPFFTWCIPTYTFTCTLPFIQLNDFYTCTYMYMYCTCTCVMPSSHTATVEGYQHYGLQLNIIIIRIIMLNWLILYNLHVTRMNHLFIYVIKQHVHAIHVLYFTIM